MFLKRKTAILIVSIVVVMLCFVFFFLSPVIFKDNQSEKLLKSDMGEETTFELSNGEKLGTVKITNWKHSSNQNLSEIMLYIETETKYINSVKYDFATQFSQKDNENKVVTANTDVKLNIGDFYILQVKDITNFANVVLFIKADIDESKIVNFESAVSSDEENSENLDSVLQLYCNYKQIEYVKNIDSNKNMTSYAIEQINNSIKEKECEIINLKENNTAIDEQLKSAREKVAEYKDRVKYLVGDELKDINSKILSLENEVKNLNSTQGNNEDKIFTLQEEIKELENKKVSLGG